MSSKNEETEYTAITTPEDGETEKGRGWRKEENGGYYQLTHCTTPTQKKAEFTDLS